MPKDFSNKNLRNTSFVNQDLSLASFSNSDLRGADFSGANLTGANFTHVKTGIRPVNKFFIFLAAIIVSLLSGYIAMLAGQTVQQLLASEIKTMQISGWIAGVTIILFVIYSTWKGVGKAVRHLIIPVILIAILLGILAILTGYGSGKGMLYIILSFLLVTLMFVTGTIARATAGSLSDILFTVVALAGGAFGKSVGGGIGTVVMAISCMVISKRALSGAKGFEVLKNIGSFVTTKFGTSFRGAKLIDADFSHAKIRNADFSNADVSLVNWGDSKKINCISNENNFDAEVKTTTQKI